MTTMENSPELNWRANLYSSWGPAHRSGALSFPRGQIKVTFGVNHRNGSLILDWEEGETDRP